MNEHESDPSAELTQEGMTPVQTFSTPVIAPGAEPEPRLRLGRPARGTREAGENADATDKGVPPNAPEGGRTTP